MSISSTSMAVDAAPSGAPHYRPYAAYKDSGVQWLKDIPMHWDVKRLRLAVTKCQNGLWGDEPNGVSDVACIRVADFDRVALEIKIEQPTFRSVDPSLLRSRCLEYGDLLLEKSGGGDRQPVGAVVLYMRHESAICSNFVARMPVRIGYEARYLTYLHASLYAIRVNTRSIKQNTGIQNLDSESYLNEFGCFPEILEQRAIASFLDRETAKIDALVAKKERLIELLQEKRTALITHAVTKGLDPNVPMKDSGVEWLHKLPVHWQMRRLKELGRLHGGAGFPHNEQGVNNEAFPFFKVGDMGLWGNSRILHKWQHTISAAGVKRLGAYLFPSNTIVFAKVGAALRLNQRRLIERPSCLDNNMLGFVPLNCDPLWSMYCLGVLDMRRLANPGAVPSVNEAQIGDTHVPVPPSREQLCIARFLDRETAKIDALVTRVHDAIERLKELRTALISAAVTGKIDVRETAA